MNELVTEVFVDQPLASPGSANYRGDCRAAPATPGLLNSREQEVVGDIRLPLTLGMLDVEIKNPAYGRQSIS